jgi:hypothetical protein
VLGPAGGVVSHDRPLTPHPDPVQVPAPAPGGRPRTGGKRSRCCRGGRSVVVRQPQRRLARSAAAPAAGPASPPRRRRPGRSGRTPATVSGGRSRPPTSCWQLGVEVGG